MKDEEYNVANFATLLSKTLIFSLPKMDEFNFSRFLKDENEILQAKDQHSRDSPTFRVHFGEFFLTIFFLLKLKTRAIPTASTESARNEENQELPQESDVSRFHIISSDEIHELCEVALGYTRSWFLWLEHLHQWTTSQRTQTTVKTANSSFSQILIGMESDVLLDNDTEPLWMKDLKMFMTVWTDYCLHS